MSIKLAVKLEVGNFRIPVGLTFTGTRIEFAFGFNKALTAEIKSMAGYKWHGFDEEPRKVWSVTDCERNRISIQYMQGLDPYEMYTEPIQRHEYTRPLRDYQKDLADTGLTYRISLYGAEPGLGKTLAAIETMEKSGTDDWWWVAPRSALRAVEREFVKWGCKVKPEMMTYQGMVKRLKNYKPGDPLPKGLVCDESQRLKTAGTQMSQAGFALATAMRGQYGRDTFIILMTGTPSPKSPVDWWSQTEIMAPGFLKEGTPMAFQRRLAFIEQCTTPLGATFPKLIGWRDDENKCQHCGRYEDYEAHHELMAVAKGITPHKYEKSINEVAALAERLKGLVTIKRKKDCLPELPDKLYRTIRCRPKPSVLRAAQTLLRTAPNAITAMTLLRELSDGFQYTEKLDGKMPCKHCKGEQQVEAWIDPDEPDRVYSQSDFTDPALAGKLVKQTIDCPSCSGVGEVDRYVREASQVPCPKAEVLRDLLDEYSDIGRLVVFAGFTGAIDRCVAVAQKENWTVVRVDGRGWTVLGPNGENITRDPLELWSDLSDTDETRRVVYIAHPGAGGVGVTLVEACAAVFYSNTFSPEDRLQAGDRIHRLGSDPNKGCTIIDIIHLPSDEHVIKILTDNRRLELMSMGAVADVLNPILEDYEY